MHTLPALPYFIPSILSRASHLAFGASHSGEPHIQINNRMCVLQEQRTGAYICKQRCHLFLATCMTDPHLLRSYLSDQVRNINNHLSDQLSLAQLEFLRYYLSDFNENIPPWPVNQWAFWKLRAVIIIFGSEIMAQVMMVIDVDCSQSIRSLERSILGFPRPSAPYFIVRQNSLLDGNTSDILRNASQVNCPTLLYIALSQHFTVKC